MTKYLKNLFHGGFLVFFVFISASCGFHKPEITVLPNTTKEVKTLFLSIDGIGYDMMKELKDEGHYKDFSDPSPFIVPFPSGTTTSYTGIFRPLNVGKVPGYETRFYSFKEDRVIGGTPWDIYKIKIGYKSFFDVFRHTICQKSVMYALPGVAGKQDLLDTEELILNSDKRIMFTYLGGTDGGQHILGRERTKRFVVFADRMIQRMKKRYYRTHSEPLRIVIFSDHGFHFNNLELVSSGRIQKSLKKGGLKVAHHLEEDPNSVVLVKYGLLSGGVMMTHPSKKELAARLLAEVRGVDLVFWPEKKKRIHIVNSKKEEAFFEYRWPRSYRYVTVQGDPLDYEPMLRENGHRAGEWISDRRWRKFSWNHYYPEVGYRLYDAFHNLVENEASVLFSLFPQYQFGGLAALAGTKLKPRGHKGTHGGIFREPSYGVVVVDNPKVKLPPSIRYDEFFKIFLPRITKTYQERHGKREISVIGHSH